MLSRTCGSTERIQKRRRRQSEAQSIQLEGLDGVLAQTAAMFPVRRHAQVGAYAQYPHDDW